MDSVTNKNSSVFVSCSALTFLPIKRFKCPLSVTLFKKYIRAAVIFLEFSHDSFSIPTHQKQKENPACSNDVCSMLYKGNFYSKHHLRTLPMQVSDQKFLEVESCHQTLYTSPVFAGPWCELCAMVKYFIKNHVNH
jgi:hypothetical protein